MGTHKNKKKKKKVEEIIGNKRSRVGTNRRWLKMTQTDKEKLEAIEWEMGFIYDELKHFDEEGFKQDSNSFIFRQTSRKEHRNLKTEWKILYRIREILEDKS